MRTWLHRAAAAVIVLGVVLCCWYIKRAADEIRGAAADMITETQTLKARMERMLSTTFTGSETGDKHTVTTNIGDQQDDEPIDITERHLARLVKAKATLK